MDPAIRAFNDCHEALKELSEDERIQALRLLFTHYNISVPQVSISNGSPNTQKIEAKNSEKAEVVVIDEENKKSNLNRENKKSTNQRKKSKPEPKLVGSLDLHPSDKISLKEFYETFSKPSNMEKNLIFVYYLEKKLQIEDIGQDHVYTCYKKVGARIPKIYQSLSDTKYKHGWIDTSNMESLKVMQAGENHIEHDIKKAEK